MRAHLPAVMMRRPASWKKRLVRLSIAGVIAAIILLLSWRRLDDVGWIPHRQITRIWSPVERPWVVGEYLECNASPRPPMTDPRQNSPGIDFLICARDREWEARTKANTGPNDVRVTYWGRVAIPYPESAELYRKILTTPDSSHYYNWPFRWRCLRNKSSVTCWAVN